MCRKVGGYVVIVVPGGGDTSKPVPQWAFRHFDTEDEAVAAAEKFVQPLQGYEAYVLPAAAYFFNTLDRQNGGGLEPAVPHDGYGDLQLSEPWATSITDFSDRSERLN